jgi:hypothetical protein
MKQDEQLAPATPRLLKFFYAIPALLLAAALFIPVLDGPDSRKHANEAVAVGKLRHINTLQTKYAAAHPQKGFACELPLLRYLEPLERAGYDPSEFLALGTHAGYKIALRNCHADAAGLVVHYQVTAVPTERGVTGFRAFCTDDTGQLWYDADGSETNCLTSKHPLS